MIFFVGDDLSLKKVAGAVKITTCIRPSVARCVMR